VTVSGSFQSGLAWGDLDADGAVDVALSLFDAHALLLLGNAGGALRPTEVRPDLEGCMPLWIAAAHLNGDQRPDPACPKNSGVITVLLNALGVDTDGDSVLDAGQSRFFRGDSNADEALDLTDAVIIALHLFQGGIAPPCAEAVDTDDNGKVDLADVTRIVGYLFQGAPPPPEPGPPGGDCGVRRGEDPFLGCESFAPCGG
jgi:hypothetical protein